MGLDGRGYREMYDAAAERLEALARGLQGKGLDDIDVAGLFVAVGCDCLVQCQGERGAAEWLRRLAAETEKLPYKPS